MVVMRHRLLAASLRPTPVQVPPTGADDLRNGLFSQVQLLLDKLARHALARYRAHWFSMKVAKFLEHLLDRAA